MVSVMTQTNQGSGTLARQGVHGSVTVVAVATLVALLLVAVSWHLMSQRITAIEGRLDRLTETLERSLPARDWQAEVEKAAKRLMEREAERWRREMSSLMADADTREKALTPTPSAAAFPEERPPIDEVGDLAPHGALASAEPTVELGDSVVGEAEQERDFDAMLQSEYRNLELTPDRLAEVAPLLEAVLDSLWPEYIAYFESGRPDADARRIRRRYCTEVESFLTEEEAARLGCGPNAVISRSSPQ